MGVVAAAVLAVAAQLVRNHARVAARQPPVKARAPAAVRKVAARVEAKAVAVVVVAARYYQLVVVVEDPSCSSLPSLLAFHQILGFYLKGLVLRYRLKK
jgi:hypothetical protein